MATEKETTTTIAEEQETGVSVSSPSEEEKESSSESTDAEKETEEAPEPEKPEESEEKKEEESFEDKVRNMATSIAQKSITTYQKKDEEQRDEIANLTAQLNEKIYNLASDDLYGEEVVSLGEEDAAKRKEARVIRNKAVLESQKDGAYVKEQKELLGNVDLGQFLKEMSEYHPVTTLVEAKDYLNLVERDHLVRGKLWPLFFPDEKKNLDAYNAAFKKFEKANDPDEVEIILEGVREGLKGKAKKYVPDSSLQGPSAGIDLSKKSARELLTIGEQKKNK